MLQEAIAKQIVDDPTIQHYVPLTKEASEAIHAMEGDGSGQPTSQGRRAILLGSTAAMAYAGADVAETYVRARRELVDMMMRDKDLLADYQGGKFQDLFKAHKDDHFHYQRESPFGKQVEDMKKGFELRNKLAGALEEAGVSRLDALKEFKFRQWQGLALRAGLPAAAGVLGWRHAIQSEREANTHQSERGV